MTKSINDLEISRRLREKVADTYTSRGRFAILEEDSGVPAGKWKNFFYNRQQATKEMMTFWLEKFPNHHDWIILGIRRPSDREFPFLAPVPKRWEGQTVGDRLSWVISEWASPKADSLFRYLEEKSNGSITSDEWAKVIMRKAEPTVEMIQVVCNRRPHFTRWVVLGGLLGDQPSVDPTSEQSVADYVAWEKADADRFWSQAPKVLREFKQSTRKE